MATLKGERLNDGSPERSIRRVNDGDLSEFFEKYVVLQYCGQGQATYFPAKGVAYTDSDSQAT